MISTDRATATTGGDLSQWKRLHPRRRKNVGLLEYWSLTIQSAVLDSVVPMPDSYFTVVETASDGKADVEAEERPHPDVVILDISMSVLRGIDVSSTAPRAAWMEDCPPLF
jgi:CheY-like chemotaxis protein